MHLYQLVLLNHILKCASMTFLFFYVFMHSFFQQMFIGCLIHQALLRTMNSKLSLSRGANSRGREGKYSPRNSQCITADWKMTLQGRSADPAELAIADPDRASVCDVSSTRKGEL